MKDLSSESVAPSAMNPSAPDLPESLTTFVGRERDVARIHELLLRDDVRLLTLTGPGGIGKTRLAQHVGRAVSEPFKDGVTFVSLATIRDAGLVIPTIADALDIREAGDQPASELLRAALGAQHRLLVLDNFEQVLPAGPEIVSLLADCPHLTALVTSRAILRVSGEFEYPVSPLTLPSRGGPETAEAVQLFVDRARAARPDFQPDATELETVAAICERLDGIPLAIELAAARLRHLPLNSLRSMLDQRLTVLSGGPRDHEPRMQTMRDAIAWSYDLLEPESRHLFRHLSVFSGGSSLQAAAAVSGIEDEITVLNEMTALLDHSLVHQLPPVDDEPRYGMLETIREYGLELLNEAGETAEAERRHAVWYLDLGERAWPAFAERTDQQQWLRRLDAEHDNIRVALSYFEEQGAADEMLRLAGSVYWFWYMRGHFSEGSSWLSRALALPEAEHASPDARALALFGAGHLTHFQGNTEHAAALVHEAHVAWRELGDPWGLGAAPLMLGIIAADEGRYAAAETLLTDALENIRRGGDRVNEALTLDHLGVVMLGLGDIPRAIQITESALDIQREAGDRWGEANSLGQLGLYHGLQGDRQLALSFQQESLRLRAMVGNPAEIVVGLGYIGLIAAATGDHELAAHLFAVEDRERRTIGIARNLPERAIVEDTIEGLRTRLGDGAFQAAWSAGRDMTVGETIAAALDFNLSNASPAPPERASSGRHADLTRREIEVLQLVACGLTNPEIAEALFISPGTARIHVSNILGKLGAKTRTEAAGIARRQGIIERD